MRASSLVLLSLVLWSGTASAKKPKGPTGPTAPGWYRADGWTADCYNPPDFGVMPEGPRRIAWNEARDAIVGQWRGERNDGVKFAEQSVTDLETVMMAKADRVTVVVQENWEQCKAAMSGGGVGAWEAWIPKIAAKAANSALRPLPSWRIMPPPTRPRTRASCEARARFAKKAGRIRFGTRELAQVVHAGPVDIPRPQ